MPIVEVVTIKSTSLARVAYDHQCATLTVEFRDGTAYQYDGVPLETFVDLVRANSKGAYFNKNIRARFPYSVARKLLG